MRCSERQKSVTVWCNQQQKKVSLRIRCRNSSIRPDELMKLKKWPPTEKEEEAATMGMEYRLASHLTKEINGTLKMDILGDNGIFFLFSLSST
jgi:hypothetical protein